MVWWSFGVWQWCGEGLVVWRCEFFFILKVVTKVGLHLCVLVYNTHAVYMSRTIVRCVRLRPCMCGFVSVPTNHTCKHSTQYTNCTRVRRLVEAAIIKTVPNLKPCLVKIDNIISQFITCHIPSTPHPYLPPPSP